jgi:hypothetical protein
MAELSRPMAFGDDGLIGYVPEAHYWRQRSVLALVYDIF